MNTHEATLVNVLPAHAFAEDTLKKYLESHFGKTFERFEIQQFQGGQSNPTFKIQANEHQWVLRKKPNGKLLPSAHMIEREYQVMQALQDTEVPVPVMRLLCDDPSVIGTPFYLMDYVPGLLIEHPACAGIARSNCAIIYKSMARTLASLHNVNIKAAGLADYSRRGDDYYARQIKRWSDQYRKTCSPPAGGEEGAKAMQYLMMTLPANIPQDQALSLVHGDFRIGNLLFDETSYQVAAVLDWELSTLGHPLADLAYCCIPYHLSSDTPGIKGLEGLDLTATGIPDEAQFIQYYCQATGRKSIAQWPFYLAFSMFRLAAILQGVYARALQGNASSANALAVGARAAILATAGARLIGYH